MNRLGTSRARRWEGALRSGFLALSLALLPLACGGHTGADAEGGGGSGTGGETGSGGSGGSDATGSGGSGGGSNGDAGTATCDVLDQLLSEGTSATGETCEVATAPGLGFIVPDDWYNIEHLVATDEGLWFSGYDSDAGGFVSALSFDGEAEVAFTMADGGVSALTLVGGDTLVAAGMIGNDADDSTPQSIYLRRLTLDGDELWTARFDSPQHYVAALAPGPDESVYVATTAGNQDPPSGGSFLRRYDAAGNLERDIDLNGDGYLFVDDMTATEEGALYALVRLPDAQSTFLRALGDDGEALWELPQEELGCGCYKLSAATDGDLYVAGSAGGVYGDLSLARVSPGGEVLWTSIVSHGPYASVGDLTVTENGAYLFGFFNEGPDSRNDALAVHFGPDGEQLSLTTKAGSNSALLWAAASTPAGDVFVAGYAGPGYSGSGDPHSFVMAWPSAP